MLTRYFSYQLPSWDAHTVRLSDAGLPLYGREQGSIVRGIKPFPAIFECDLAFNLTDECSLQT